MFICQYKHFLFVLIFNQCANIFYQNENELDGRDASHFWIWKRDRVERASTSNPFRLLSLKQIDFIFSYFSSFNSGPNKSEIKTEENGDFYSWMKWDVNAKNMYKNKIKKSESWIVHFVREKNLFRSLSLSLVLFCVFYFPVMLSSLFSSDIFALR